MIFISIVLFNICLGFVCSNQSSDDLDALGDYDHEIWNIGANNVSFDRLIRLDFNLIYFIFITV